MDFDYFYGRDSESLRFIRLPVVLMEDEYFKGLSIDAKVLYSMYLSRSALSHKNNDSVPNSVEIENDSSR